MIVIKVPQGSPEWFGHRAGAITASMFSEVRRRVGGLTEQQQSYVSAILEGKDKAAAAELAGYKKAPSSSGIEKALAGERVGDYSEAAKNYAFRLAIERLTGAPLMDDQFETFAMRRGHELEPQARDLHSFLIGRDIAQTGLVLTDNQRFGASADGLIGDDGGSEYKCFVAPEKLRAILIDDDWSGIADQVQGCMWITGRQWWHIGLYCPALADINRALTIKEVQRDDAYIEALEADLIAFDELVCGYMEQLNKENQPMSNEPSDAAQARQEAEDRRRLEAHASAERSATAVESMARSEEPPKYDATPANDSGARIKLGELNALIAPLSISADGLAQLGFEHVATDKAAKLYRASDLPRILGAMSRHLMSADKLGRAA